MSYLYIDFDTIPYIRPFIPNENTDETTINNMFKKILNQYSNKKEISIIISGLIR